MSHSTVKWYNESNKFTSSTFRGAIKLILKTSSEHVTLLPFTLSGNSIWVTESIGGPVKIEIPNRLYRGDEIRVTVPNGLLAYLGVMVWRHARVNFFEAAVCILSLIRGQLLFLMVLHSETDFWRFFLAVYNHFSLGQGPLSRSVVPFRYNSPQFSYHRVEDLSNSRWINWFDLFFSSQWVYVAF